MEPVSTPFREIADRVWVARLPWYDVNVTLVAGSDGVVVVDTHASEEAGRELRDLVAATVPQPIVAVVNTHHHVDHVLGNAAFGDVPVIAHEATAVATVTETVSSARSIDLGDRFVELVHPGPGHTAGDLVVRVPDADVLLAGDLVEEAGPPDYGDDSLPLGWPAALDLVTTLLGPQTLVVPGHGAPVDRDFVMEQRSAIGIVAETIRQLAGDGVRAEDALAKTEWPYPVDRLEQAVRRGYQQLPRSGKRLPMAGGG